MVPMPKEAAAAAYVDPLSGLTGLSLFPRTIRATAGAPVPADSKDLDSIHNIMKSLKELRSPEKLMSEAKKIVDGGANLLTNFSRFGENASLTNDIAAKAKDVAQERRPGLGVARKKAPFSLRTSISHPSINLEPTLDISNLQDPDAFFDAYERNEKAKKEIQKQLGVGKENIELYKPSNNERCRRPGILGNRKSFNYKHRYSSAPSENDDMLMSSQETVSQDILSPPKDVVPEKLIDPDPNLDYLEEVEMAESMKKTESQVSDMLEELLSCNDDELDGQGALDILQDRLKIRTLDMEKLFCLTELPDVGRTNILTPSGNHQKRRRSSGVLESVLKNLNKKPCTEQELVENSANFVSSPTPPRNPSGSMSLLQKKILQPNPLTDPFSPQDIDLCEHPNSSPLLQDKQLGEVDTPKELGMSNESESHVEHSEPLVSHMDSQKVMRDDDSLPKELGMSNELESHVEFAHSEPLVSHMDSPKVMSDDDSLPKQSQSENARMERKSGCSGVNASPSQIRDKLAGKIHVPKNSSMFVENEPNVQLGIEDGDGLIQHFKDVNANITKMNANSKRNEESVIIIDEAVNANSNESNPSVADKEARDDASNSLKIVPEPQELRSAKRRRGTRTGGKKRIIDSTTNLQIDPEHQEFDAAKQHRVKRVGGGKRIRDAHPMRKSLAEAGTAFEDGLRKSTRVRMRPLEYWKGERLLYERVDNSLKLIGLKYISPGKGSENLKVKTYEEILEMASRH